MEKKIFSREEILDKCKAIESDVVDVPGWNGAVKMHNVKFSDLVQLRVDCPEKESYQAALISAVCEDLTLADTYALQKGNGFQFASLFSAVNGFLGCDMGDEEIKK